MFATTEVDKVPVTVRSRCQRFDLRRVEADVMVAHLAAICAKEGVAAEPEALGVIARAAEGSVRDALSLLDQAIAHGTAEGAPAIAADRLRAMLGLADHTRIIDLFEAAMGGAVAAALDGLEGMHDAGADPAHVLADLAEFVHLVTRLKLVPGAGKDPALTEEERTRGAGFAARLSVPVLTRAWQLLVKGLADVKDAPRPLAAADMVLVRLACAADLPTPDEALRRLAGGPQPSPDRAPALPAAAPAFPASQASRPPSSGGQAALRPRAEPAPTTAAVTLRRFEDVVAMAQSRRDIQLKTALERDVRPVRFEPGTIELELAPNASPTLAADLMRRLGEWTGTRWMVAVVSGGGAPTLRDRAEAEARARRDAVAAEPLVRKVLDAFPGSEIVAVRSLTEPPSAAASAEPAPDDEVVYADDPGEDDL